MAARYLLITPVVRRVVAGAALALTIGVGMSLGATPAAAVDVPTGQGNGGSGGNGDSPADVGGGTDVVADPVPETGAGTADTPTDATEEPGTGAAGADSGAPTQAPAPETGSADAADGRTNRPPESLEARTHGAANGRDAVPAAVADLDGRLDEDVAGSRAGTPGGVSSSRRLLLSGTEVGLGPISLLSGSSWLVPGAAMTGSSLAITGVVAQLAGGASWLPVARRTLGTFGIKRG